MTVHYLIWLRTTRWQIVSILSWSIEQIANDIGNISNAFKQVSKHYYQQPTIGDKDFLYVFNFTDKNFEKLKTMRLFKEIEISGEFKESKTFWGVSLFHNFSALLTTQNKQVYSQSLKDIRYVSTYSFISPNTFSFVLRCATHRIYLIISGLILIKKK